MAVAFSASSAAAGCQKRKLEPERACTASATFSSAVKRGSTCVIWNERARPSRARAGIGSAVTSRPSKWMCPASGASAPEIWWMSVVLPAPFGPMMACVSPASTSRLRRSVTLSAPNDLSMPSRRRTGSLIAASSARRPR